MIDDGRIGRLPALNIGARLVAYDADRDPDPAGNGRPPFSGRLRAQSQRLAAKVDATFRASGSLPEWPRCYSMPSPEAGRRGTIYMSPRP